MSRFDLFHGHLFLTRSPPHGLGILFHAAEYPAIGPDFKVDLGFCQLDSPLAFDVEAFDRRNWLFFEVSSLMAGVCTDIRKAMPAAWR